MSDVRLIEEVLNLALRPHRQLSLVHLPKPSTMSRVLAVLRHNAGRWMSSREIHDELLSRYELDANDATITARIRDLRKPKYGGHEIGCRRRAGERAHEYSMGGER